MIFGALQRFKVVSDPVRLYPELTPVAAAVKQADWPALEQAFATLRTDAARVEAVWLVAEAGDRVQRFLQPVVDRDPDSGLARTLLGARYVRLAWAARSAERAEKVSDVQWDFFFKHLRRAEGLLTEAVERDRTDVAAWTERIVVARGLELGAPVARLRYQQAAEHCDGVPYHAQAAMVQNLAPKWDGTREDMHAFADECRRDAPAGSLGGAVIADAVAEDILESDQPDPGWLDRLGEAAAHTVLHPTFAETPGWVPANCWFAFAHHLAGDPAGGAPHFAALGERSTELPWSYLGDEWRTVVRVARCQARKAARA